MIFGRHNDMKNKIIKVIKEALAIIVAACLIVWLLTIAPVLVGSILMCSMIIYCAAFIELNKKSRSNNK